MKKLLFAFLFATSASFAGLIDAIALVVNDDPITLYDIEKRKVQRSISKEDAVSQLVDEVLFSQLVKKHNITADVFDVNNYLEKIAASNGMDLYQFKAIIKQKYKNYAKYEEQTRQLIIRQKLTDRLVRGNLKVAEEDDLKIYYENNIDKFQMASNIKAIQYSSKNKASLNQVRQNPMLNIEGINREPVELNSTNLNPQLRYMVNQTKVNQFTPVFAANKQYISLLITSKAAEQSIEFEEVKDRIFNIVMQDREKKFLKDYFEKLKLTADIKVVR